MEFDSPSHILPPDGARICHGSEVAQPGDWILSKDGRRWEKLIFTTERFQRNITRRMYATKRPLKKHQNVVLSDEIEDEIRARWERRPTYKSLAAEYGCSPDRICAIVTYRSKKRREHAAAKRKAAK